MNIVSEFFHTPHWGRQNHWRKAIFNTVSRMGLTGVHALPLNRRWVEIHRQKMPLRNLDAGQEGLKIAQISDLHYSPVVWERYLLQFIQWVNDLEPDVVVVTGDLITGGYRYAHRIATILSHLKASKGVICTFGNHDYSIYGKHVPDEGGRRADYLEKCLAQRGLTVLRNEYWQLPATDGGPPLTIVGLDDEWSGHIDPKRGFEGVKEDWPVICLNHNPANVLELMEYPWQWMLAGHTHGRQIGTSRLGQRFVKKLYRHYTHGYYAVRGRHLYVNRGLSYGQRVLDWCRPEITAFKLVRELEPALASPEETHTSGESASQGG